MRGWYAAAQKGGPVAEELFDEAKILERKFIESCKAGGAVCDFSKMDPARVLELSKTLMEENAKLYREQGVDVTLRIVKDRTTPGGRYVLEFVNTPEGSWIGKLIKATRKNLDDPEKTATGLAYDPILAYANQFDGGYLPKERMIGFGLTPLRDSFSRGFSTVVLHEIHHAFSMQAIRRWKEILKTNPDRLSQMPATFGMMRNAKLSARGYENMLNFDELETFRKQMFQELTVHEQALTYRKANGAIKAESHPIFRSYTRDPWKAKDLAKHLDAIAKDVEEKATEVMQGLKEGSFPTKFETDPDLQVTRAIVTLPNGGIYVAWLPHVEAADPQRLEKLMAYVRRMQAQAQQNRRDAQSVLALPAAP